MTKLALVTGCHGGLGAHVARTLRDTGFEIVGVGRRGVDTTESVIGGTYVKQDVRSPTAAREVVAKLDRPPTLVVHAASIYPNSSNDLGTEQLAEAFQVNATFPYLLNLALLEMPRPVTDPLTLVSVNSEAMFHAGAGSGVYGATKAALRVLTTAVSDRCNGTGAAACTLTLGPLLTPRRDRELRDLADRYGMDLQELTRTALARSNPDLVIDQFISLDACVDSVLYLYRLGPVANGMVCRLDGGSSGSLR